MLSSLGGVTLICQTPPLTAFHRRTAPFVSIQETSRFHWVVLPPEVNKCPLCIPCHFRVLIVIILVAQQPRPLVSLLRCMAAWAITDTHSCVCFFARLATHDQGVVCCVSQRVTNALALAIEIFKRDRILPSLSSPTCPSPFPFLRV